MRAVPPNTPPPKTSPNIGGRPARSRYRVLLAAQMKPLGYPLREIQRVISMDIDAERFGRSQDRRARAMKKRGASPEAIRKAQREAAERWQPNPRVLRDRHGDDEKPWFRGAARYAKEGERYIPTLPKPFRDLLKRDQAVRLKILAALALLQDVTPPPARRRP